MLLVLPTDTTIHLETLRSVTSLKWLLWSKINTFCKWVMPIIHVLVWTITYSFTSLISKNLNLNHVWVNVSPNARESGIQKPRNFGSWNLKLSGNISLVVAQGIWDPTNDWNLESNDKRPESSAWTLESKTVLNSLVHEAKCW